jgi:hypothetical protein
MRGFFTPTFLQKNCKKKVDLETNDFLRIYQIKEVRTFVHTHIKLNFSQKNIPKYQKKTKKTCELNNNKMP